MEASNVITTIYDLDTMENTSDNFCDIMSHVMFDNSDKHLKTQTLVFWHKIIDVAFRRQGIEDGHFPEATFSKQLKRIIHFDRQTIRNALNSILNDLSQNGCLGIFTHVFREEQDFDICNAAKVCFENLTELLKKYNISYSTSTSSDYYGSPFHSMSPDTDFSGGSLSPPMSPVSFISDFESINVEELEMLDNSILSSNEVVNSECILKVRQVVTPYEFLKFIDSDFDPYYTKIKLKADGQNNLDNILDQILLKSV